MTTDNRETTAENTKQADPSAGSGWAGAVPNLEARTVVGVFDTSDQADAAIRALRAAGHEEVSFVNPGGDAEDTGVQMGAGETKTGTGIAAGAVTGVVLGGLAGLASVALPGIGSVLAAGPIAAVLTGAATGGALGGLIGSFVGLGIPKEHAERYEAAVRRGGAFVSVRVDDEEAATQVGQVLTEHKATDVSSYQSAL